MNILPKPVSKLIDSFHKLPGIGPKTATRLAFYLLHVPQSELSEFSENLLKLKSSTVLCSVCKNVSEKDPCAICSANDRDMSILCVVEQPTDVLAIEKTNQFHGVYHVLHGVIDPLNNIGPDELYIRDLISRIGNSLSQVKEVILALNPNMEGEATSMYISKQIALLADSGTQHIKLTRLAHGLPIGADIEYADDVTLTRALEGRRDF